ncbi:MAG: Maf family protein [Oleiphilaceae bacterium]|nr:Maf family protein [Oleiphilaceae bacterium]
MHERTNITLPTPLESLALRIVLASGSKYRRDLLQRLGLQFEHHSPDINEQSLPAEEPEELARRLALSKARALINKYPNSLIIGSDQVAWLDGKQLHKPGNAANNRHQLASCAGRVVHFYTAIALINSRTGNEQVSVESYETRFKQLSAAQIAQYVEREKAFDCAGGFKMEGLGIALFDYIRGDDPNSLIGLPLIRLCEMLNKEGLDVLTSS